MTPIYKEFHNDEEVVSSIQALKNKGISGDNIYIVAHDDDRTKRVADNADANTIGMSEQSFGEATKNLFRQKGDELRTKFNEVGFTDAMAEDLEESLDEGKIVVVVKDAPEDVFI
ncbi:general stress protein [Salipaludibacillus agaradhaerens]|uniref:General stress protein n=1 Tax=Salipaludibacillus agaradhaerens TaxID=76935 RepID=A0A9Q4B4E2_SALAG|nr:general stress protein [Salipaludibacillus agaradhaerens]MCR6097925.1 general stress protein [Salipaludibacillus agaradhaerens]MCR6116446.1 general stress protein [Salipaludibacillus agaradhaerens]